MSGNDQFLNPYNFIPFPEKRSAGYETADGQTEVHTGVITYTITAKSPLFIPNTSSEHAFATSTAEGIDHKSYDFYSYTELEEGKDYSQSYAVPVIPGSELRGMIRGIYETLTGSCMGVLNADIHPVKRTGEVFKAGLIRKEAGKGGSLSLVEAEDCIYRESTNFRDRIFLRTEKQEGQQVFFQKPGRRRGKPLITECVDKEDEAHPVCGYLIKGMMGPETGDAKKEKHNCHIFIPKKSGEQDKVLTGLDKESIERLKQVLTSYQEQPTAAKDSYKEYQQNLNAFLSQEEEGYFPVYYSRVNRLLYLSPASITKEISNHSIGELAGEFKPCESKAHRCPACELFGMTGESNEEASASKIRFADALVLEEKEAKDYYDPVVTLEALGGPKLSNIEFYLEQAEGADFWTYDYYTQGGEAYPYEAKLRGRKYYWHQPDKKLPAGVEKTELNKTVRPVKNGVRFEGKLYFNRISDRQLKELLWILNGGNEKEQPREGEIAYKLGGGKPLGLGSVKLQVKELSKRRFEKEREEIHYRNQTLLDVKIPDYEEAGFLAACKEDFFTICGLNAAAGKNVTYPIVPEQHGEIMTEGFKWFVQNHTGYDYKKSRPVGMPNARIQMRTLYALPKIQGVGMLPEKAGKGQGSPQREGKEQQSRIVGKVTGYNKNKTTAYILLEDGRRISVYFRNIAFTRVEFGNVERALPFGSKVEVVYEGKQPDGYDKWKCTQVV